MLVTVSSSAEDVKETISSLNLARRVKSIELCPCFTSTRVQILTPEALRGRRVKSIELGGAKKGVENEQLNELLDNHRKQTAEQQARMLTYADVC